MDRTTIQITVHKVLSKKVTKGQNMGSPFLVIDYGAEKGLYVWPSQRSAFETAQRANTGQVFDVLVEGLNAGYPKVIEMAVAGSPTAPKQALPVPSQQANQVLSKVNESDDLVRLKAYEIAMQIVSRAWAYEDPAAHTIEDFQKQCMETAKSVLNQIRNLEE